MTHEASRVMIRRAKDKLRYVLAKCEAAVSPTSVSEGDIHKEIVSHLEEIVSELKLTEWSDYDPGSKNGTVPWKEHQKQLDVLFSAVNQIQSSIKRE